MRSLPALLLLVSGFTACCSTAALAADAPPRTDPPPRSLDPRLAVTLFAESPQIVTPTGISVDSRGRVWAIESNTHFPPEGYQRHTSDRILVMRDTDGDGHADEIRTFLDGLTHTMSVSVQPNDDVYVATRGAIYLCRDHDGDERSDHQARLVHLETAGNYPHNGLAGFAFDAIGWMYFGFGENLGASYKIIGSDGTTLSGGGEGGNLYRCRLDGSQLTQWATGFWNPHANCFDAFGRLFSVDNDPDSRPPCRLLHIIPDGDYGYRFRNGRKGLHPFTSWNGEIPGTLPMVAGTGEAPSGIIAYESDGLPEEYLGNLFVTTWGDHRIDRFQLKPKGTSFTSLAEPLITGNENFRPVGLAVAPDGSIYFTDWVLRDYKLHGQGRVWRIAMKEPPKRDVIDVEELEIGEAVSKLVPLLTSQRIEMRRMAARMLAKSEPGRQRLLDLWKEKLSSRAGVEILTALAQVPRKTHDLEDGRVWHVAGPVGKRQTDEVMTQYHWLLGQDTPQFTDDANGRYLGAMLSDRLEDIISAAESGKLPWTDPTYPLALLSAGNALSPALLEPTFSPDGKQVHQIGRLFEHADPFLFAMLVNALARCEEPHSEYTATRIAALKLPRARLGYLLASRRHNPLEQAALRTGLKDSDPAVRRAAVQWAAEEKLTGYRPQLQAMLNESGLSTDLFVATLAGLEMLDGVNPADIDKTPASKYVLPILKDDKRPASTRTQALRLAAPTDSALDAPLLTALLAADDPALKLETVRTLQLSPLAESPGLLLQVAADAQADPTLRAEAVAGLANAAKDAKTGDAARQLLNELAAGSDAVLQVESLRSLRGLARDAAPSAGLVRLAERLKMAVPSEATRELAAQLQAAWAGAKAEPPELPLEPRPASTAEWLTRLEGASDPAAGRRIFFHANSAGCYRCHTIAGRGGRIGPDLSTIARTLDRRKLAESILEPSREIAPQFVAWSLATTGGQVHSGLILSEESEKLQIGTSEGKIIDLKAADIEERTPQRVSLMPEKLPEQLTLQEFRDLLAFLETLK